MLHSVVTCCTVLQHAAQCCNMLYSVATCCAVLQHAVHAAALCRPDAASAPSSAPNVRRSCAQCTRPVSGAVLHPVFSEWHAHACAPRARTLAHSHTRTLARTLADALARTRAPAHTSGAQLRPSTSPPAHAPAQPHRTLHQRTALQRDFRHRTQCGRSVPAAAMSPTPPGLSQSASSGAICFEMQLSVWPIR